MVSLLMKIVKIKRHLKKFPIDCTMISWYYSVVDIIAALTDSPTPRQYWGKVKEREFVQLQLSPIWVQLKLPAQDGNMRQTDCAKTKGALRLVQTIPSNKKDPNTFTKNKNVARCDGKVAGTARKETEKELGRSVISKQNYLDQEDKLEIEN